MKIIHCADIHLNSKMASNLTKEKAKERKAELLHTFIRMVDYAVREEVQAVIIAGDLFDHNQINKTTRNAVYDQIKLHPWIEFYYLQGNHDSNSFLSDMEEIPENLKLFGKEWITYIVGESGTTMKDEAEFSAHSVRQNAVRKVAITGAELDQENSSSVYHSLVLDAGCFNIVVMHGQESEQSGKDKTEIIALRELRNKGIDYLALGHIHRYKEDKLDARGTYCYCGCLEGRGFDECGEHGFVLLEIDEEEGTCRRTFVPFACRQLYEIPTDVSGCHTTSDMKERIDNALEQQEIASRSMVKVVLTGEIGVNDEMDIDLLAKQYQDSFYFFKIKDQTKWKIDYHAYELDESLKGEFIRTVREAEGMSEEDKAAVIRYGILAVSGEDISII
ncbi:MAG: metallophosphoesterase [Lachnospiraceae bacterium]|nr:metallophosphoesterase [Lachnospiraceae bacterium]